MEKTYINSADKAPEAVQKQVVQLAPIEVNQTFSVSRLDYFVAAALTGILSRTTANMSYEEFAEAAVQTAKFTMTAADLNQSNQEVK